MAESFTSKQKEIVARKMGYDGPMQGFDDFLASSPSDALKYSSITSKFVERMAKGGVVTKYADGGVVTAPSTVATVGTPLTPGATTYTAAQTAVTPAMLAAAPVTATPTPAAVTTIDEAATVTTPQAVAADTLTAALPSAGIKTQLGEMPTVQGEVSDQAQAQAVTQEPTTTAVGDIEAAQATAGTVAPVAERVATTGELVSGPTVDMTKVEDTLAKTQAAQGVVAEEMTVQGQLNKLLTDFDAGQPPAWAAASMRTATAQMAARGIGASSMAGQAIIQATLEAAAPIAAADAKIQETMALQNLSNRQAVALDLGKQRAAFLGQEFDQSFQTRVLNAATISDIADKNFDASVTIALENARIASTTNLSNLSARNAMVLANAAQVASLETANLNNRQIVAVENAKAFLSMDLKNLDIEQQTSVFKAKTIADALVSDASFANAAAATNASNKLESDKINATLSLTAEQYNAAERNKIKLANADAANELIKFNAQEANDRQEFNSRMSAEINVANAKLLAEVSTINTAATNAANATNAKNVTDLSAAAYAQQSQTYRDLLEMSFNAGENEQNRITQLAVASISKSSAMSVAETAAGAKSSAAWGELAYKTVENWDTVKNIGSSAVSVASDVFSFFGI